MASLSNITSLRSQQKQNVVRTTGSNKALRAAVRNQRRNQARQNIATEPKEDQGKDKEDVKTASTPKTGANVDKKEREAIKSKGP